MGTHFMSFNSIAIIVVIIKEKRKKGLENGKERPNLKRQNSQQKQTLIYYTDVGNQIENLKQQ